MLRQAIICRSGEIMSYIQRRRAPAAATCLVLGVLASFPLCAAPVYTTFDVPDAASTFAQSINASGAVTGFYQDASGATHGFVRANDGTIATFEVSGAAAYDYSMNRKNAQAGQ